ncbi:helix-turn-helix domain-containing protein [Alicyclobacillus sp. TC]|uniref:helix-turn-helix domain-containing protein n=1 Tax=Alicyclobacillus sp. TC TaxID=2606450 RepID=UPI0019337352|nr:helix-turn-helix domain-containing protein [Alicyclobacillus sp. TC]QRF22258.1 helix-turn-helix domain-containing protein [Alicyclobacillus sp. TC]
MQQEYAKALTVPEVAKILGIGLNKAYQMANLPDFPCMRHGNRIIIPPKRFFEWLDEQAAAHRTIAG